MSSRSPFNAHWQSAPLLYAAASFSAGIVLAQSLWFPPPLLLVAALLSAALCLLAAWRALRLVLPTIALLFLLAGCFSATMQRRPAPDPVLAAHSDNLARSIEGDVVRSGPLHTADDVREEAEPVLWSETDDDVHPVLSPAQAGSMQYVDLRLSSMEEVTDNVDHPIPASGVVRLSVRGPLHESPIAALRCGEHLRLVAQLNLPHDYHDPGVTSHSALLLEESVTATAFARLEQIARSSSVQPVDLRCRLRSVQQDVSTHLRALPSAMHACPYMLRIAPHDADLLAAMVAGDRAWLSPALRLGFERTASFHMLVVSGFHLAIVAGVLHWLFLRLHLSRIPATLLTLAGAFAYAVITGFATPVERSFWMVALYLFGRLFERDRVPLNTIGFAALCLLAADPQSLWTASLQMTMLAVFSIGGIAWPLLLRTIHPRIEALHDLRLPALDTRLVPALAAQRICVRSWVLAVVQAVDRRRLDGFFWYAIPASFQWSLRVVELFFVGAVLELAMALPMLVYFHRITLFALPVNVLLMPLLALLLPLALLLVVSFYLLPQLAVYLAIPVAALLHLNESIVALFNHLPLSDLRAADPQRWQVVAVIVLLALAVACAASQRVRCRHALLPLLLAALLALWPPPLVHPHNALFVEMLDVAQGDSILLIAPDGKTMLIDGGGIGGRFESSVQHTPRYDVGEEVVSAAMWVRGIRRLDVVALTHAHADHMGGLPAVLRNFRPHELWVGNNPHGPAYDALLAEAHHLGIAVRSLHVGQSAPLGPVQFSVLAPTLSYRPAAEPRNNDSLVLRAAFAQTSILLTGDAEAPVEASMLAAGDVESTVLKIGHHGSLSSTTPDFLARVHPRWALISCGLGNRYGHPRDEVLARLQSAGIRTLSTDLNGVSCLALDGQSVQPGCDNQPGSAAK